MGETDTISRQAALDTIMGQPPEPHYPSWYAAQIEELPAAQPEQRWIPVTERLPEKPCYCLTSNEYSNVCEDFYWGEDSFEKANKYHYEVLAWMPLPEPYKGGETE